MSLLHCEIQIFVARVFPSSSPFNQRNPQPMVNRNLIRELELGDDLDKELEQALAAQKVKNIP